MKRGVSRKSKSQRERLSEARSAFAPLATHQVVAQRDLDRRKKSAKQRRSRKVVELEEAREQKRFVAWARKRGLELNHQNNGASSKARRIHLHQMGCTAGAADVLVFDRLPKQPSVRGLALEFKSASGDMSPAQVEWQNRLRRLGWRYHLVRSAAEAQQVCLWYGL